MDAFDKEAAHKLITLFSGAVKGMAFYPPSHPVINQQLTELHELLELAAGTADQISLGLIDGLLYLDDHLFITPTAAESDLTNRFLERDISKLSICGLPEFEELELFLKLFAQKGIRCEALSRQLLNRDITCIQLLRKGEEEESEASESKPEGDSGGNHVETYNRSLATIRTICRDIERGRIPNSAPLIGIVDQMASITMADPSALLGLTMIKDYDNYTFNHCVNVGILAMAIGASLGMDEQAVRDLGIAGQLHDIGKTMISKDILNKPGKLSSDEFEEMKRHPEFGSKIIKEMQGIAPQIASVVLGHHLHYNRSGYPEWASKLPFNQMVDIIAVADTYDAITTLRVYQHPVNPRSALLEMQGLINTMLDGTIVERFVTMMGSYPVGTLVRLDTNEVAIVNRPNPLDDSAPMVRILIDGDGNRLRAPREESLAEQNGSRYARIVAVVDPLLKNIDISRLIESGNY